MFTLRRDKANDKFIAFHIDWEEDDHLKSFVAKAKKLWASARKEEQPFADVKWHKIRRMTESRLHSLRNRKAILLLRSGESEEEVKIRLGWSSLDSLTRYTKMPKSMLKAFDTYDDLVNEIRGIN